ncbi:MAG: hypothetical protein INF75_05290 [Roseomonas sp.]|nr:hypothetical protein [Roseomonas sp.]MCA3327997.1 hypothetical protein [Roseomonas sp.]MCA3332700.1 hypothetical protein [Roseomonas sp.]MCA3335015.1 hypothetical protein [Roseomonas sp.]MCA3346368.1 hypothetical protein [Roseomonas sp.]
MRCDRRVFLAGLIGLGACSGTPPEVAQLPEFRGFLSIDPVRYSIEQGADILTNPRRHTGQPWETARLIQALEFLAVELPNGPRWNVVLPMGQLAVPAARPEWRQAFGIAADARAQEVIDSLTELRRAFAARSPAAAVAALRSPLFTPGGQDTLNRFGEPPALPRTTRAMLDARMELAANNNERRSW